MKTEVLIVGGGLAGLSLADKLAREGVDFLLVEAQNRLGGRILTEDIGGGAFDPIGKRRKFHRYALIASPVSTHPAAAKSRVC